MRIKIVLYFVYYSLKNFSNPWLFFQIHAKFFNKKKGIFSKYELENHIPKKWKLESYRIKSGTTTNGVLKKLDFPIFGKPEWGQNAHGIKYITTEGKLQKFIHNAKNSEIPFLLQESSNYIKEFEICYTKLPNEENKYKIWSIVESEAVEGNYINSIHSGTKYKELLHDISEENISIISQFIEQIGHFEIARLGVKADSFDEFLKGKFKIFEINIFIPLPLKLLAYNVEQNQKKVFLRDFTESLVLITKYREKTPYKEVFLRKIYLHYKIKMRENIAYKKCKRALYSWIENTFMDGCSDYNSIDVRRASRSKKQARDMFAKNGIPHAKGEVFINPYIAYKFVKQHGFPVVLKPNVGGYSRGSHFPITNYSDFWKAMFFVKFWWPRSVIETYLLGKNYRVVVTKNSVDIAMQRYPASVIGDGKKSISLLIDDENEVRTEMNLSPIIHLIEKSNIIKKHLKKQNYSLSSILEKGEQVFLYHRVSLAPGGVLETVDVETITQKNKALFLSILNDFEANIFGIDVIMEQGIEVDYDKQKTIFLELNSRPYLKMHTVPRYGVPPDMKPLYSKLDSLEIAGKGLF